MLYNKGSFVEEVAGDLNFQKRMKDMSEMIHTCYRCSKSDPEFIILDDQEIPFDEKDKIQTLHDVKFHCELLNETGKARRHCSSGDSEFLNRRCSKCIHAGEEVIGSYTEGTDSDKIKVQQRLIHCKWFKDEKEFCYPYFWCDKFKLKKGK